MVTYEITATVAPTLAEAYERYMRERHIPDLLATGCFVGAIFSRAEAGRYRIRYESPSRDTLGRYLAEHAPGLRAHFEAQFPAGVQLSREQWESVQCWGVALGVDDEAGHA